LVSPRGDEGRRAATHRNPDRHRLYARRGMQRDAMRNVELRSNVQVLSIKKRSDAANMNVRLHATNKI
jgi:hypothetical protein